MAYAGEVAAMSALQKAYQRTKYSSTYAESQGYPLQKARRFAVPRMYTTSNQPICAWARKGSAWA